MNFPKLAEFLAEAKKADDAELDMDFDADLEADEGEAKPAKKSKDDAPAVDKAAVLAFLKDCDAACRKAVKSKLDRLVAADEEQLEEAVRLSGEDEETGQRMSPRTQQERNSLAAKAKISRQQARRPGINYAMKAPEKNGDETKFAEKDKSTISKTTSAVAKKTTSNFERDHEDITGKKFANRGKGIDDREKTRF